MLARLAKNTLSDFLAALDAFAGLVPSPLAASGYLSTLQPQLNVPAGTSSFKGTTCDAAAAELSALPATPAKAQEFVANIQAKVAALTPKYRDVVIALAGCVSPVSFWFEWL